MKALIFGANGQDGHYLSAACRKRGMEVVGMSRSGPWLHGDVASFEAVEGLVREHQPYLIFHLAATSTTSHEACFEHHNTIAAGTLNILEAVKRWSTASRVFITGSGVQFVNHGGPISEADPFDHSSVYTAARNYSVYLARYFRSIGVRAYVGYLFHHESPLRTERHVCQKVVQAVRRIAAGSQEVMELGDISVRKEWAFAEDIADGIMTLVQQDRVFEAVIGSGQAYSIEDWLAECFKRIHKDWRCHVREKKGYKAEYQTLISDPATMHALGWKARTTMSQLAGIMLTHKM